MRAVLFDLDGTLLDIDLDGFLRRYFSALEVAAAGIDAPGGPSATMRAIKESTGAMMQPHAGVTNEDVFYGDFRERTGVDLTAQWHVFEQFYVDVFPTLRGDSDASPGARAAIETARSLGLHVAIATNPIFPRVAVEHRLAWAGLDDLDLEIITSYENMTSCKPAPDYYRQTAEMVGVEPMECLMVGDDRFLDMPAADTGMRTFYVGPDPAAEAHYRGDLLELATLLPRLAADGEER